MGRLVLILGGARSGKSAVAERMAGAVSGRVTFVATAEAGDQEMKRRIEAHRAARPASWHTVEEPLDLPGAVAMAAVDSDVVVVDCLTVWVSNRLCRQGEPESTPEWSGAVERLESALRQDATRLVRLAGSSGATLLLVSNEVGWGLVPPNPLGRVYRDLLGMVNRLLAGEADQVLLMVAGLPVDVKRLSLELP